MLSLALIVGLWTTTCIQTQMGGNQGYVTESYTITQEGKYEFKRDWYSDPVCSAALSTDTEEGTIKLGKKLSGMFVAGISFEADFENISGKDLGAVQITSSALKVARGMKSSSMRNTMVGIFEYKKQ